MGKTSDNLPLVLSLLVCQSRSLYISKVDYLASRAGMNALRPL
jgi:hypothetical protein